MPKQKRGESKQDYETPGNFLAAVTARFGTLAVDLAARADNAKAPIFITPEMDSLKTDWSPYCSYNCWLNPPFSNIGPWAERMSLYVPAFEKMGGRGFLLTPASVGANWYRDFVHGHAHKLYLNGRIQFVGAPDPYPKDLMLSVFGFGNGSEIWTWKK